MGIRREEVVSIEEEVKEQSLGQQGPG